MPHKVHDNLFKTVFGDHTMFAQFLRDFIPLDIFKNVQPEDIEDVDTRFIPLDRENRDSDTIKRVNLKNYPPFFVIAITEHESKVNYRSSFKILLYITLVLEAYEKECDKRWKEAHPKSKAKGISHTKKFKYPPVISLLFYDGPGEWTAETNFLNRTELSELFGKYIPSFEYIVVNLNKVSREKLLGLQNPLSFVLLADKVKGPEELESLTELPEGYREALEESLPGHLKKLVADVVIRLLKHAGIDEETIGQISDQIEDRRPIAMFEGITKGWAKDRRELVKLEKANAKLEQKYSTIEQKYSTIEQKYSTVEQEKSAIEQENALLKERLRQLEQNQPGAVIAGD
jgi:hypothetical protein